MKNPKVVELLHKIENLEIQNTELSENKIALLEKYKKERKTLNQKIMKNHREIAHLNNKQNVYLKQQNLS